MITLTEIKDLFVNLAEDLRLANGQEEPSFKTLDVLSSLNKSVNFDNSSGFTVLETALSLMCFRAPEVCKSTIECLVETIVVVLLSSICCDAASCIGSSIPAEDCTQLIEACAQVIPALRRDFGVQLSDKLFRAVLAVAALACETQSPFDKRNSTAVSKLHFLLQEETLAIGNETPSRLLLWYLDPLALKHDISEVLREAMERPFLCLRKELHDRVAWRSLVICLVSSPTMFIEARTLLHSWFLRTGVASIQHMCIEMVASVLDALSKPMRWGMSIELGLKLPFPRAYFPIKLHEFLMKLSGSVSSQAFVELVHLVVGPTGKSCFNLSGLQTSHESVWQTASEDLIMYQKAAWEMLLDFPCWFYFASMILFAQEHPQDKSRLGSSVPAVKNDKEYHSQLKNEAARYIAWMLYPAKDAHFDLIVDCLTEILGSWPPKKTVETQAKHGNIKLGQGVRFWKAMSDANSSKICQSGEAVRSWLEYFDIYQKKFVDCEVAGGITIRPNSLFRKVPLGILLGWPTYLDENECELLLHYVATGDVLGMGVSWDAERGHLMQESQAQDDGYLEIWLEARDDSKWFVHGAALVFDLFDLIEDISLCMCANEDSGIDLISQIKSKACKYLIRCVKKLLELETDACKWQAPMLQDLNRRLEGWRQQCPEVFIGCESVREALRALDFKIMAMSR